MKIFCNDANDEKLVFEVSITRDEVNAIGMDKFIAATNELEGIENNQEDFDEAWVHFTTFIEKLRTEQLKLPQEKAA